MAVPVVKAGFWGYKYVPWKNIEWETLYSKQEQISNSDNKRTLVRTQMDFHF